MVQKWRFFHLFFGNIGQENVFYDIVERKNAFVGYKNKKFKSRKIDIFQNGLTHGLGQKMAIFPPFFKGIIGQGNIFYDFACMITSKPKQSPQVPFPLLSSGNISIQIDLVATVG